MTQTHTARQKLPKPHSLALHNRKTKTKTKTKKYKIQIIQKYYKTLQKYTKYILIIH